MSAGLKPRLVGLALGLLVPSAATAAKLDKDSKRWLEEVQPIILPDEEKTFRDLEEKSDREEFRKIFWARRDPDLATPENEYRTEYEKVRAAANGKFRVPGVEGARTDCGRVFVLLGAPDHVEELASAVASIRRPEVWTYRNRPWSRDAEMKIEFDGECRLPQGARLGSQLNHFAETKVVHPNLDYRKTAQGRLVKLADQLPKGSPASELLKTPRQNFPVKGANLLYLRGPQGSTYVAGLLRAEPGAVSTKEEGGKKVVEAVVAAQALDEQGKPTLVVERKVVGEPAPDGSFTVSYGIALKAGEYTLRAGLLDPATGKGSVMTEPVEVPALSGDGGLVLPSLLVLRDAKDVPASNEDPLAAFQLGGTRIEPRLGNVFKQDESVLLSAFVYNPAVDPGTGKPSFTMTWEIRNDAKQVAQAPAETYDQERGATVGPVALASYAPGKYVAKVMVHDNVANKDYAAEATFEVVP